MAAHEKQRTVYRSMQGREIDMHRLMLQNELTVAVGNIKVNARGDELGPGGQIIRKREEVLRDSGQNVPNQINTRTPPVQQQPIINTITNTAVKDVSQMDPAGEE